MHPLVKGAPAIALLMLIGSPAVRRPPTREPAAARPWADEPTRTACGKRALPLDGGCVALPGPLAEAAGSAPYRSRSARERRLALAPETQPLLSLRAGEERIPRLPDRPEKLANYQLPVEPVLYVTSPADEAASRERPGIEIDTEPEVPVTLVELEGAIDRSTVALVGELHGVTVIVRHRLAHPAGEREVLAIYGNLGRPGPHIVNGAPLGPMAVIGTIGAEEPYLYFETRLMRAKLDRPAEHLSQLTSSGVSVPIDPRNVLPLRK